MQQVKDGKGIQAMISGALAAFAVYMRALAVPIIVLMVMMVLDYLSGMAAAWTEGGLSSKVGAWGILKKSRIHGADRVIDGNLRRPI